MELAIRYKAGEDRYRYYYQVLTLLSAMPALRGLRPRTVQVLAHLLRHEDLLTGQGMVDREVLGEALFSYRVKVDIATRMGVSDGAIRTAVMELRKRGLVRGKELRLPMRMRYLEGIIFSFSENGTT